jgi:hypothetical protein
LRTRLISLWATVALLAAMMPAAIRFRCPKMNGAVSARAHSCCKPSTDESSARISAPCCRQIKRVNVDAPAVERGHVPLPAPSAVVATLEHPQPPACDALASTVELFSHARPPGDLLKRLTAISRI